TDEAEIGLRAAGLEPGEHASAEGDCAGAGVEAGIDDHGVEEAIEVREGEDGPGDELDDAVEDEAIYKVRNRSEQGGKADDGGGVEGVDVEGVVQQAEEAGLGLLERVIIAEGLAAVEGPAEEEAEDGDDRRGDH